MAARIRSCCSAVSSLRNQRQKVYSLIQEDVGHDLSRVKAQRLWAYAWAQGHANGFPDVYYHLQDMVELAKMLL